MFGVSYNQYQFGSTVDAPVEHPATLRFRVTWAYLAAAPRKAEKSLARAVTQPKPAVAVAASPASQVQWEMVVPKMARPPAKPAPARIAPPLPEPAEEAPVRPLTLFAETEPEKPRHVRLAKWGLVAMAVIGGAILARPRTESAPPASMSLGEGWSRQDLSPPGRQIIAYDLSRGESNYGMEFSWAPSDQPAGWVFRTRDSANYYGARLSLVRPGDSSAIAVEHFSVLGGLETPHSRKVVKLMNREPAVRIRMNASGPVFTLYVQGNPVDNWTDQRLPTGGFGFYEEGGQRPVVQSLHFTFFNQRAPSMPQNSPR